ncbi:MAG: hypothetical protein EXR41_00430 [Candidatus Methylopumilus sp.]|nr:hypothetical protein [Candidatus Methylopumilus sp.]
MRKVKRIFKKYFGVTRRSMRVKTGYVWHTYLMVTCLSFLTGAGVTYWELNGGSVIGFVLKIQALEGENQSIEGQLLQQKIELQLKSISGEKVSEDITKLQAENNKLKEDVLFYEKIVGKKR